MICRGNSLLGTCHFMKVLGDFIYKLLLLIIDLCSHIAMSTNNFVQKLCSSGCTFVLYSLCIRPFWKIVHKSIHKSIPICFITSFGMGILFSSGLIFLKIFPCCSQLFTNINAFLNVFNHAMPEKLFRNFLVRRLTATMSCQGFGHWIVSDSFVYIVYYRCSSFYFKHNSSFFFVH